MARNINNILINQTSGKIGKQVVMKSHKGGTIVTQYPDRSKVELSLLQRKSNGFFRQAVAYAQELISDPIRKAELEKKLKSRKKTAHQDPYHAAIQEFMLANARPTPMAEAVEMMQLYQQAFPLSGRQAMGIKYLALGELLSNAAYQNINKVSKATATRDLQDLVSRGIIALTGKGAGAKYILVPLQTDPRP
ncbi:hypothetical protein [Flavihumibacter fluvii]|uniref:hypothetical protein n=1 Tax=Flavihumibacter fluvii TaxID=2838157 RepID=UPI001BDEF7F4|nr:hypothetical protein [Flavihumibacter fluvii]ULQ52844.1 hypothetical protein KJS93_00725 [Flavihumibacter fluvii]